MPPRYYTGPISDHFDGVRFFDPHRALPKSRRDLLRWFSPVVTLVKDMRTFLRLRRVIVPTAK
jgi:hypothetical protein